MCLITSLIPSALLRTPCTKHLNADLFSLLCFLDMMLFLLLFLAAVLSPSLLQDDYENMEIEHLQTTKKSVQEDIVKKHNQLRRMVFPPGSDLLKMKWDLHGEWRAQMWADKCIFEKSPVEFRDMDLHCGENIFVSEYPLSWSCVIQSWYDKSIDYRFGSNILPDEYNVSEVIHHTRIVWNSSYTIACGVSKCPDKPLKFMYVCRYCPLSWPSNSVAAQLCTSSCHHLDVPLLQNPCSFIDWIPRAQPGSWPWISASAFINHWTKTL
uniref:SCP domain-containing protein n=1 Tax=Peromyscus maniculatus bairdii TaxID=230844 RepID=A0A8C8UF73_PERMB